jgi:MATE family multidrug resistance protein
LFALLRVGAPFGVQVFAEILVWSTFVNILVGQFFGTAHLIATNTAWQYLRIAFMPCNGVGRAVTALVGRSIGAGDHERAMRETRFATILTLVYMGALAVVYVVFRRPLIALFNDDPLVVDVGGGIMICAAVFQLFDAIGITYGAALRGAGDTLVPSIFFVISHWLILVGGGWFIASRYPQWGSLGPWLTASGLIIVASLFLIWRWHGKAWLRIRLAEPRMVV